MMHPKAWVCAAAMAALVLALYSCDTRDYRDEGSLKELADMEYGPGPHDSAEIAKLKNDIIKVRNEITALKSAQGRLANFYNALGEEYRRLGMFAPALEAYQKSLEITGGNHAVLYKAGIMAAQLSMLEPDPDKAESLLAMAETYYENSIRLGEDYEDALYALAVIKYFERSDRASARDLVGRALAKYPNFIQALFLAARIAVEDGALGRAREYYQRIVDNAQNETDIITAKANLEELKNR